MIDVDTIIFIGVLNDLARKTKKGFKKISQIQATDIQGCDDYIMYDDIVGTQKYPVVSAYDISEESIDVVQTYSELYAEKGLDINVLTFDDKAWILVTSKNDLSLNIVIEYGYWYQA